MTGKENTYARIQASDNISPKHAKLSKSVIKVDIVTVCGGHTAQKRINNLVAKCRKLDADETDRPTD